MINQAAMTTEVKEVFEGLQDESFGRCEVESLSAAICHK